MMPNETINFEYLGYFITTDKSLMHVDQVHKWLIEKSYWAENIPYEIVKTTFDNSYCIGVLLGDQQIGFARLVTDYAVFGYLADVYVLEEHRGKGLSKIMIKTILNQDWVKGMRGIRLATKDAQALYEKFGFTVSKQPERHMEIVRPDIYKNSNSY